MLRGTTECIINKQEPESLSPEILHTKATFIYVISTPEYRCNKAFPSIFSDRRIALRIIYNCCLWGRTQHQKLFSNRKRPDFMIVASDSSSRIWAHKNLSFCTHKESYVSIRFIIVITQLQVTIATNCRGLEASSHLFQTIVSITWVLIMYLCVYVKRSVLYKGDSLRLTIFVCYSWEMVLSVGLDVSFVNM